MIIGTKTENKQEVKIDLNTLVRTRALIQANSGGGKSWLIRRFLEQSHGKIQQIVIDLDGEFSTLREQFDYLLVGKEGEIPADIKTAELLAKRLLEINVSTIIDLSEMKHYERILFVKRFLDSLINSPKKLWHPVLVLVDEAHQFCPQTSKSESASSVIDLMTRGRKRGFCGVLATQRISKLHKDASAEANNRMIGRTGQDIDRKRASEELGFVTKEDERSLRNLEPGEFYMFGPAISIEVIKVKVGTVKTTHPDISMNKSITKPSATPENIKKVLKDVVDLSKQAQEELIEIQDYKNKISELKKELKLAESGQKKIVDEKQLEKAKNDGYNECKNSMSKELDFLRKENTLLIKRDEKIAEILKTPIPPRPEYILEKPKPILIRAPTPIRMKNPAPQENGESEGELGLCAKKIYSFLYNNSDRSFSKSQVGAMTGYSQKSGGFNNALYRLNAMNLISRNGNMIQVQEMNPDLAGQFDFSKDAILTRLGKCPRELYQFLLNNPNQEFSKEELAEQTGYSVSSGGFNNAVYNLNTLGLIERNGGMIKLNKDIEEL
jgi:hypothetical protein